MVIKFIQRNVNIPEVVVILAQIHRQLKKTTTKKCRVDKVCKRNVSTKAVRSVETKGKP